GRASASRLGVSPCKSGGRKPRRGALKAGVEKSASAKARHYHAAQAASAPACISPRPESFNPEADTPSGDSAWVARGPPSAYMLAPATCAGP
ncbi:MAG: hypothetical protein AAFQ67_00910, partial [Pseudomonadota bacterium]